MFGIGKMNHQSLPLFLAPCLFFISLSQTSSNTSSHHHCLPDQSAHLLQLRQEFVERNYSKMKSWKADNDCCSWDGVTCDTQNGEVIGLDLSNSWLYGPLNSNSSLFSLPHLRKLNLDSNNFSPSTIPPEFGQLLRLTHLNLSRSSLRGRIPSQISWLSNLVSLDLSFNYFSVGGYYYEKLLDLRRIDLEALLQNMTYLRELHLDHVNISSSLPQSLANLSSLTSLSLSWCYLQGKFASDIFLLPKIQAIDLSYNRELIGFLPKFLYRSSLKKLHLRATNFSGEFPNSMDNLGSLNVLDLSETDLFGELLNSISNLKSLNYLDLSDSKISGELPSSISNLNSLNYLDLSDSKISGELPSSISNLNSLNYLDLSYSKISGELPSSIGSLNSLNYLDLQSSNFSGAIPPSIGNLSQLTYLALSYNNFHGQLPSTFGNLAKLTSLYLDNNLFNQEIQSFLGNLTQLEQLSLSNNNFGGIFPIWLTNITKLNSIDLSNNRFYGEIPNSVGNLKALIVLNLSGNNFMSHIPSSLENLSELESLDLSRNSLFGEIPQQLISLTFLEYLNLSLNQLFGPIPRGGQFMTFESSSFEGNLGLCGPQLSKKCENNEIPPFEMKHESSLGEGFGWKVLVIGYACGLVVGLLTGHVVTSRRTDWLVRNFELT